jgi:hypothetical protein
MDAIVLLQTLKFTLFVVGYLMIESIAPGMYPVVAVGSALKSAMMLSVVATPVAATVTTVAQALEAIALVPIVAVPLAMVNVPFEVQFVT